MSDYPAIDFLYLSEEDMIKAGVMENPYPTFGKITMLGTKFMDMLHEKKITEEDILDLGQLLLKKKTARKSDEDIIIYSVGGMPVEDVAWGTVCYRKALTEGIGTRLPVWSKPYMS